MTRTPRRAASGLAVFAPMLALVALLAAACGGADTVTDDAPAAVSTATPTAAVADVTATPTPTEATPEPTPAAREDDDAPAATYDPTLTRDDVDCSLEFVSSGGGEEFPDAFVVSHFVVDGVLGEPCHGSEDERLLRAWEWLRLVAAPEDLEPLILFAGFDTTETDLLAYVEALTAADGSVAFQMTVNLLEAAQDDTELALTMAHEFTHIFTGVESELDRGVDESQCTTYFEGEGCYTDNSYIARWTEAFWVDWIDEVDPLNPDDEAALDRCIADPSFLGSYAATNPEEDFAETFSAYVFSVPVEDPGLLAKYEFFEGDPRMRAYRARVQQAGILPLPNSFEGCGF